MKFTVVPMALALIASSWAQNSTTNKEVERVFPDARALYVDLDQTPELSGHETRTAAKLASRLGKLGYDVTEHVGGTGLVAVLKSGLGPTVMLRTELDALPVEEKTGLPYASKVHAKDDAGHEVPVAHACGHDLHMAAIVATAEIMASSKNTWHGTLMLIGQPAEETIRGARGMVRDGLFERSPGPMAPWQCMLGIGCPLVRLASFQEFTTPMPIPHASPSTAKAGTAPLRKPLSIPS